MWRMRRSNKLSWIFLIIALPVFACLSPTRSPLTPTAIPTDTLEPTRTPHALTLGDPQSVEPGGFSFQAVSGFRAEIQASQVTLRNPDATISITLSGAPSEGDTQSLQSTLDNFLNNVAKDASNFKASESYPVTVGGTEGLAVDISGELFGDEITGTIVVASPENKQFFFAFGFAANGPAGNRWEGEGSPAFDAVLSSIRFFEPVSDVNTDSCPISDDETYGYTEANPIQVGGGDFDGPPRERAYLDNLRGPNGEPISYSRLKSFESGDTILDSYEITVLEDSVTLYLDEYNYSEPQAPIGFTCAGEFPLTAP
jgi:hypothetical protein